MNIWQSNKFAFQVANKEGKEGCHLAFEILRRVARAIPITKDEGGPSTASSFTYKMRDREDPRFTDRRMQSLLVYIEENLEKSSPSESAFLCK